MRIEITEMTVTILSYAMTCNHNEVWKCSCAMASLDESYDRFRCYSQIRHPQATEVQELRKLTFYEILIIHEVNKWILL